jgi:hypothetical protein
MNGLELYAVVRSGRDGSVNGATKSWRVLSGNFTGFLRTVAVTVRNLLNYRESLRTGMELAYVGLR